MATINVLILMHGMTPDPNPLDHASDYAALWQALTLRQPALTESVDARLGIEWGHEVPGMRADMLRPDQRITRAENVLWERVGFERVRNDRNPDNHLLGRGAELGSRLTTRRLTDPIKETVLLLGVTDAFYYCAPDGERAIRGAVYTQFLDGLEPYRGAENVRLHVIAQSLGVTVAFDFLFGLFAPDEVIGGEPDFIGEGQGGAEAIERYRFWRGRARDGGLVLASKSSTGGLLPLLMMRKQSLVERFSIGQFVDPAVIGVPGRGDVRWKIFYDADDILGFPTRRLFDAEGTIQEYQVNTDWRPDLAHSRYWTNDRVLDEIAKLIADNLS